MDRRRKMLRKRRSKQSGLEETEPGCRLIFKEGTAAVAGKWEPGSDETKPLPVEQQP